MPEVNRIDGNYYDTQAEDMLDSLRDAFWTPLGSRAAYPEYGFIVDSWPQVIQDDRAIFEAYVRKAARQDPRVESVDIEYNYLTGKCIVTANGIVSVEF